MNNPYYENNIENEWDVPYVEIGCLTGEDPVKYTKIWRHKLRCLGKLR